MSGLIFISAYINSQDFSYSSDRFLLDSEKNSLFFEGHVTLNFEEFIFNAEKAELDRTSEILKLESLSFKVKDQFVWGEAEKGAASKSKISFQKAKFSLCPCEEKIWWIEADEVDLDIKENNISFERGKLKINDKSVFYFPRGSFPASGGRRSGFLLPEISASNKSGTDISIPYYFNLASNYDFTFEPRYISKRGEGGLSEFRYLSKNYNGYIKTSFLSENSNYVNQDNNESFRWSLNFVHNAKFLNNYFLNINYSNLGDSLFLRDFGGGFSGQSDHLFVPQKITVANFGENYEFGLLVNAFKLTSPLGINQYQEVPEIKLNYFFNYESFDFRIKTKYQSYRKGGSFFENSKDRVEKLKLEPEILFFKNFSQIDSMIKINYTFENFYLEKNKKSRILPKAELKLSKDLVKNKNDKMALLSPFFSFIYAKNKNQENLPNINSGFFLDSRSFSKDIVSGDSYIPMRRDILIGADYSLYEGKNKFNISFSKLFGLGKRFLRTDIESINLPEPYQMKLSYKNDKTSNLFSSITKDSNRDYDSFNIGFNKKLQNKFYTSTNFTWIRNVNSYIFENNERRNIKFLENTNRFYVNEKITLHSKIEYDLKNSNLSNLVLGIEYENPGLVYGLALIESNELDWFRLINENTYNEYNKESFRIYFELKGLGSLGRKINQYTEKSLLQ